MLFCFIQCSSPSVQQRSCWCCHWKERGNVGEMPETDLGYRCPICYDTFQHQTLLLLTCLTWWNYLGHPQPFSRAQMESARITCTVVYTLTFVSFVCLCTCGRDRNRTALKDDITCSGPTFFHVSLLGVTAFGMRCISNDTGLRVGISSSNTEANLGETCLCLLIELHMSAKMPSMSSTLVMAKREQESGATRESWTRRNAALWHLLMKSALLSVKREQRWQWGRGGGGTPQQRQESRVSCILEYFIVLWNVGYCLKFTEMSIWSQHWVDSVQLDMSVIVST